MPSKSSAQVPHLNLTIYGLIYTIEVALRELIIERLSALHGPKWYVEAIPGGSGGQKDGREVLSMLDKYRRGQQLARSAPWTANIPHHPVYYLDFPELSTIIERKSNWNAFQDIFGRKEITISTLRELEPIRNKVAHNRKATAADLRVAEGAYEKLSAAVGKRRMAELSGRSTNAEEIPSLIAALDRESDRAYGCCTRCEPLEVLKAWPAVSGLWWFESEYLGHDVGPIETYFSSLEDYSRLPRVRGAGHRIERWLKTERLGEKHALAKSAFDALLENIADA